MPWIQLKLNTTGANAEELSDALMEAGSVSITFQDTHDTPVFEPLPGETRLWGDTDVIGLFDAETDMKEVVAILLQIGMWVTPIMWNFESMQGIPKWAVVLLKLNPMYYIVSGYRDALINKTAFWEHPGLTLWFWGITLFTLWAGTTVFKRLRVHFADVL
mgnify:CR=1 FL=1